MTSARARVSTSPPVDRQRVDNILARTPLSFEENRGQAASDVLYVARSAMYGVALRRDRVTLTVPQRANVDHPATDVSIRLTGSRTPARVQGIDEQKARSFYYKGQDASRWITGVPHVARVRYESVYPGVDVMFYGSQRRLEFDFLVAPQASVSDLGLDFDGVDGVRLDETGDLVLQVAGGELIQHKPVAYQERDGARVDVEARYVVDGSRVRFDLGTYDRTRPLVIDPIFESSTYIGGSSVDNVTAMALDRFGQLHVAGLTQSADFPSSGGGASGPPGTTDIFLMRFSPTNELLTTTVIGGPANDVVYALSVDTSGAAYLVGSTGSGFPTTAGAYDQTWNGGDDAFATKISLDGQIVYSTYIGGSGTDEGRGAAVVDGTNELLIAGDTNSTDFPRTMGPAPAGFFDVFLVRLNANGSAAGGITSRLIGGSADDETEGLAVRDAAHGGTIVIAGDTRSSNFPLGTAGFDTSFNGDEDVYVTELTPAFAIKNTTFLGGSGEEKSRGVAVLDDDTFVTGYTKSNNFPGGGTRQGQDAFVARLGPNLATLVYSHIFLGAADDTGYKVVAGNDPDGATFNAYVIGDTTSADFSTSPNALQSSFNGANDVFVVKVNGAGTTMYQSLLGGNVADFGRALVLQGTTLWVGGTTNGGFPIAGAPFDGSFNGSADGFVARFSHFEDTNVTQRLLQVFRDPDLSVTSAPPGIVGSDTTEAYPNGTVVTLTAAPGNVSWTGCDSANANTCVVTMNGPKTVSVSAGSDNGLPFISSMTPRVGSTFGGTLVTITGQNLDNATHTFIDGVPVRNLIATSTQLTFLTPAHSPGAMTMLVSTESGSTTNVFTYVAPQRQTITNATRPSFSFDGRWMAFESSAALVDDDTNGLPDIFVRDRTTGKVVRVSLSSTGVQAIGGGSRHPSISATGRFVAFESAATNLVPGDTNQATDIFVRDRDPDGNGIFDETAAGHTPRTFRVNLGPPTTSEPNGAQALGGVSEAPSISGNGRWIAFESAATNLVPGDTNQHRDVFVYDTLLGRTVRVSVSTAGDQALNGDSTAADISLDGHVVAFQSAATNLVPGDSNGQIDVFIRDRDVDHDAVFDEAGAVATIRVSVTTLGLQATGGPSTAPSITADGMLIAFVSEATNLVAGDTNQVSDIFLRDRTHGTTRRMSLDPASGQQFTGASYAPAISANGNTLIFSVADISTPSSPTNALVTFAADTPGTQTGGTVTIPGPNTGNGPETGTMNPGQAGETQGDSGVSGDGSTTGTPTVPDSAPSQIDMQDNDDEQSTGGNDVPFIADVDPAGGPPAGGSTVDIIGNNIENGARVQWGAIDLATTFVDGGRVRVVVPPGNEGTVPVSVRSGGELSNALTYTYRTDVSTPRITTVTPLTGSTAGGTPVTIAGTGFAPTLISVKFHGRDAEVTTATQNTLTLKAPANLEGPATIVVLNTDGGEAVADDAFVYSAPPPVPPVITGLFPSQGYRGVTTVITVRGQAMSFAPGTTSTVNGQPAVTSFYSDSTLVIEAPPTAATGNVPVVVTVPGAGSATATFLYTSLPDPFSGTVDSDGDGMSDTFELAFGLNPNDPSDANGDPDGDGLTNVQEAATKHHPFGLYTRYLAEGAANDFFETRILIANPNTSSATVLVHFQRDTTPPSELVYFAVVPPMARIRIDPAEPPINMPPGSFATVVESNLEVAVDRTMYWDKTVHYGSTAETSLASPATTWYLAEGATNDLFQLFYLLQNPDLTRTAHVQVRYIRGIGNPIVKPYEVGPQSRLTIPVNGQDPGLAHADISAVITTDGVPIIVERAMYAQFPGQRAFESGHDSAGVTAASTDWFLAEGATGPFFEEFILYENPGDTDASVDTTYLMPDGSTITKTHTIPANRRVTIQVSTEDAKLVSATASARIKSTNGVPIIVERTMWWPAGGPWIEAHNSPGSTSTGTRWAVADGEIGGPPYNTQTFLLIANTSSTQGRVRVTLLFEDGSPVVSKEYSVVPQSRQTIPIGIDFPQSVGHGFGALIESLPDTGSGATAQIVVERAMYSDTPEHFWGAGTNVLATKLK